MIEGTQIRDTPENREVLAVLARLQAAMRARDADAILATVSPAYFEDNGTPDPRDDYGFEELRTTILPQSLAVVQEVFVAFKIFEVVVDDGSAYADVRYASRAKLDLPSGTLWDSHREFNRVELAREQGAWRITSGL
jgi:hypothetical protein